MTLFFKSPVSAFIEKMEIICCREIVNPKLVENKSCFRHFITRFYYFVWRFLATCF